MSTWQEIRKPDTLDTLRYMVRLALEDHDGRVITTAVQAELERENHKRWSDRQRENYLRSVA